MMRSPLNYRWFFLLLQNSVDSSKLTPNCSLKSFICLLSLFLFLSSFKSAIESFWKLLSIFWSQDLLTLLNLFCLFLRISIAHIEVLLKLLSKDSCFCLLARLWLCFESFQSFLEELTTKLSDRSLRWFLHVCGSIEE